MIELTRLTGARDATVVDANFTAIETATAKLLKENFAHEAFDRAALEDEVATVTGGWRFKAGTTRQNLVSTSWAQLNLGATVMRLDNAAAGFTVPTGAQARVRCAIFLDSQSAGLTYGIEAARTFESRLVYQLSGGGPVEITGTRSWKGAGATGKHGCLFMEGWLPAGTYDWVETQYLISGGAVVAGANVERSIMTLVEFKEVV